MKHQMNKGDDASGGGGRPLSRSADRQAKEAKTPNGESRTPRTGPGTNGKAPPRRERRAVQATLPGKAQNGPKGLKAGKV